MMTQTFIETLTVMHCPDRKCGIAFGVLEAFEAGRRDDHGTFYCPRGHSMSFSGKSETEQLRENLASANRRLGWAEARETALRDQQQSALRSAAAYRGQVTRIRNLIARGVCPVAGCRRNFDNVRQHMAAEHPEFHKHEDVA